MKLKKKLVDVKDEFKKNSDAIFAGTIAGITIGSIGLALHYKAQLKKYEGCYLHIPDDKLEKMSNEKALVLIRIGEHFYGKMIDRED